MKKLLLTALTAAAMISPQAAPAPNEAVREEISCKAAYLCDSESGTCAFSHNETERLPIASMCKIMTLLLSFEAAEEGSLSYDEEICVSENASGMGGSQVFLGAGLKYQAGELMKTVAVCSANDSCVALAERIAGSESLFVEKMNARAKELGAENTLFANCTGLPKDPQYSCAKDVAIMLRSLLSHEKYFEFSKIWLEDFSHPDGRTTTITNTNKLVRFYDGCDGGKTGFTNQAGFCLAATAKRGNMRLISVVIGADSSQDRFDSVRTMLDFAFACYENRAILTENLPLEKKLAVKGSRQREISVCAERPLGVFVKKGEEIETTYETVFLPGAKAPIRKGEKVGEAILFCKGVECGRCALLAAEDAEPFRYGDAFLETARNFS